MPNDGHAQHAAEYGDAQRSAHFRAGAGGEHQRQHAEDEGERGHQDRPQPQPRRFLCRIVAASGPQSCICLANSTIRIAFLQASADQHDQSDLHEDVDVAARDRARRPPSRAGTAARPG